MMQNNSSSDKSIIDIAHLKKFFGSIKAVNDLSFQVNRGEIFGLLGPNGAGKTTTIKLLLGFLEATEGQISVFGLDPLKDGMKIKKKIGYVPEEPQMYKSLTPRDLFNFIGSLRNLRGEDIDRKLSEYLTSLDALPYYNRVIATLSRGNKQKVQLIAAFLHEPELLILDEPLTGLDAKSVKIVKELLQMHVERGGSIILSTHILEIAQDLCDRIAIINQGTLVGIGTLKELQNAAQELDANLEDIFLKLTEQDVSIDHIVKKLRETFIPNHILI